MPGGNNSQANRFPLPDNWNIDDFICVIVPIPNDPQYISTFRGLLDTLTWQRSFRLHRTENAAYQVSKTWQRALESRELKFLNCEEFDMTDLRRVKPGEPWISQQSVDNGVTWHDYLIQPNWSGMSTGAVWPSVTDSASAQGVATGITRGGFQHIATEIITQDGDGFSRDIIANNLQAEFARFNAIPATLAQIRPIVDALLDSPTPTAYEEDCQYVDFWTSLSEWIQGHPSDFNVLLGNWMQTQVNALGDDITTAMAALNGALGGDNFYYKLANLASLDGSSFGDTCTWSHYFDFTTDEHGWVEADTYLSTYFAGQGWQGADPSNLDRCFIHLDISPAASLTKVKIHLSKPMFSDGNQMYWARNCTVHSGCASQLTVTGIVGEDSWPDELDTIIEVGIEQSAGPSVPYDGYIVGVTFEGNGLDPF